MSIKKIKIGTEEHELQTTIANVDGLQAALDGKANTHSHPYLSSSTKYAGSSSVGGAANSANIVNITRPAKSILEVAGDMAIFTEAIYFFGSDGLTYGAPVNYVIINAKKGANHRTILDCYALQTGDHYINGCMTAQTGSTVSGANTWTGWVLQPNKTSLDTTLASAKSYTDTSISNLINGAPTTLDTLKEIADAMQENADVVDALETAIGNKVDKVSGKGLSTNDYTTAEKNKLSGIAAGAQVNQNAFTNVVVGSTTIAADSQTDSLTITAGTGISVAGDATNDKVTIANTGVIGVKGSSESSYRTGNVNITPANIGLGNVNNTSDANKPVSTAQQQAIDTAIASIKNYSKIRAHNAVSTYAGAPVDEGAYEMFPTSNSDTLNLVAGNNLISFDVTEADNINGDSLTLTIHADPEGSADAALEDAKAYTNDQVSTLNTAISTKVDASELANYAPLYTYGTEDLTAGSSALETGKLYFVYE